MLNAISWQQYLTAILLLGSAWYSYVGLRYYRTELSALLKIKTVEKTTFPNVAVKTTEVLGAVQPESDTDITDANGLIFSNSEPDDVSDQTLPKGPSDDLLAEGRALVNAYEENENKAEFLSLLNLLIDQYEVYRDEILLGNVMASLKTFAASRLPFTLNNSEWPIDFKNE